MKKILMMVSVSLSALLLSAADYSDWAKRQLLTFETYGGAELTDFPVLVVLDPDAGTGFSYLGMKEDGTDLRFTDAAQNELSYEIDTWNPEGKSYVWVKIPTLNAQAAMLMHFGNPDAPVMNCTTNGSTWDANYIAVWHMNLRTDRRVWDSTSNKHHLTNNATTAVDGLLLGKAASFSGSGNTQFLKTAGNQPNLNVDANLTIEVWAADDGVSSDLADTVRPLVGKRSGASDTAYNLFRFTSKNMFQDLGPTGGTANRFTYAGSVPPAATMTYHATTFDGVLPAASRAKLYRDGAFKVNGAASGTPAAVNKNTAAVTVGALDTGASAVWKGTIDEVRLSKVTRSPEWLAATQLAAQNQLITYVPVMDQGDFTILPPVLLSCVDNTATLGAQLLMGEAGTVAVTNFYGTSADDLSFVKDCGVYTESGIVEAELSGLDYAATYYAQFVAVGSDGKAITTEVVSFTTLGAVTFTPSSAQVAGRTVEVMGGLADRGLTVPEDSPVSVTAYFGDDPQTWEPVQTWTDLAAPCPLTFEEENSVHDTTYYWSFVATATMPEPDGRTLTFYSPTNQVFFLAGVTNTWQGTDNGAWAAPANWSGGVVPTMDDTARFASNPALEGRTISFADAAAIQCMVFDSTAGKFIFEDGPGLDLNNGGSIVSANAAGQIFNMPVRLAGNATFNGNTSGSTMRLAFSNSVTAAGASGVNVLRLTGGGSAADVITGPLADSPNGSKLSLVKEGTGLWQLSGDNTFSGGIVINQGVVRVGSSSALGTGTLTMNGGTLSNSDISRVLANNIPQIWNGSFSVSYGMSSPLNMGAGPVTMNRSLTVTLPASAWNGNWTVGGAITATDPAGVLSIVSVGDNPGRMVLLGANDIQGGVIISNTPVALGNQQCFGTGPLWIFASTFSLAGDTMGGQPLLGIPEISVVRSLGFTTGGRNVNLGTAPLKLIGTNVVFQGDEGSVTFGGEITDESDNGCPMTLRQAQHYGTVLNMNAPNHVRKLRLQPGTGGAAVIINFNHPYAWGSDELIIDYRDGQTTVVAIQNQSGAAYTIPSTNRFTWANSFVFGSGDSQDVTIANGSVTLVTNVNVNVSVAARTLTVTVPIGGDGINARTLQKNGAGTLVLGGDNSYKGGTIANAGTLRVTSTNALAKGKLTITPTGKVDVPAESVVYINELVVDGVSYTAPGDYTAARFPGLITGEGTLRIPGMIFTIF